MIIGYFRPVGTTRRPFIRCDIAFPAYPDIAPVSIEFVIDTGSDMTSISLNAAERAGLRVAALDTGQRSRGVGSEFTTRVVESRITVQDYSTPGQPHSPEKEEDW